MSKNSKMQFATAAAINIFDNELKMRRSEAARRYAAADKSDPFAYSRAMSHNSSGLCSTRTEMVNGHAKAISCHYDADTFPDNHEVDERWAPLLALRPQQRRVQGTSYRAVVRP